MRPLAPVGRVFVWGDRFFGARVMVDRGTIRVAETGKVGPGTAWTRAGP